METKGAEALERADVPPANRRYDRWVEARYRRQVHQLRIAAPAVVDEAALGPLARAFEREYERLFGPGSGMADAGIELVNYGVDAVGVVDKAPWKEAPRTGTDAPSSMRDVYCPLRQAMVPTPVYDGPGLPPGTVIAGPAAIEHSGTTIVILAGQSASIDAFRHTHITIASDEKGGRDGRQ
jgi:N-methylhydantoinase A